MSAADSVKQTAASADSKLYEPSMEEILASIRRIIADDQSLPGRLSAGEEEDRLRAILTPQEPASPASEPTPVVPEATPVRAIFAPHPVAPHAVASAPAATARLVPPTAELPPMASAPPSISPLAARDALLNGAAEPFHQPDAQPAPAAAPPASAGARTTIGPDAEAAPVPARPEPQSAQAEATSQPVPASVPIPERAPMSSLFSPSTDQSVTAAFNTLATTRLIENDDALRDLARDMLRPMLKEWLDENLPVLVERLVRDEIERVGRGGR